MKTREQVSSEILALNRKYTLLALPTGFGKTRTALDVTYLRRGNQNVLIVYPKVNLKQTWIDEFNKWGYTDCLSGVTFTTYNSIAKHTNKKWDVIIFDEGHHITERVLNVIDEMRFDRALILSATVKTNLKRDLEALMPNLYTYNFGLTEAINSNVLPDPKIILVPLKLNSINQTEQIIKNPRAKRSMTIPYVKRFAYKNKSTKYIINCTETEYIADLDKQVDWYKRKAMGGNPTLKNLWLQKAGMRLKWLASKKTNYVKSLLSHLENERTLTFCASINQSKEVGKNCIHSKNKDAASILAKFNTGEINHITACNMLDEGVNLVNCRISIFANINSSERIQIQRVGRSLRHSSPVIVLMYFQGTREEEIVRKMIEGYNKESMVKVKGEKEILEEISK